MLICSHPEAREASKRSPCSKQAVDVVSALWASNSGSIVTHEKSCGVASGTVYHTNSPLDILHRPPDPVQTDCKSTVSRARGGEGREGARGMSRKSEEI